MYMHTCMCIYILDFHLYIFSVIMMIIIIIIIRLQLFIVPYSCLFCGWIIQLSFLLLICNDTEWKNLFWVTKCNNIFNSNPNVCFLLKGHDLQIVAIIKIILKNGTRTHTYTDAHTCTHTHIMILIHRHTFTLIFFN